ncbi:hypothetical protein GW17_00035282 [Ensete ventricosum]|nr:hypothetical protein GW17_00035282 [Ensete ventricosum]
MSPRRRQQLLLICTGRRSLGDVVEASQSHGENKRGDVHYIVAYRSLQAVKELAEKARAGKLKPDQYQGGSFR